ncbi:hypothetical protein PV08_11089 [Exophiala spinifera]|uniref:Uncharacterized protein n=1 Tax=Exophiala spinifera TaxID=91928 RepID=A0A0D2BFJ6_9EURO|nr:uncharacterized protein PV08_11089 [Exophiala spinifera]KIW10129.1 hypothetical protein PV08_11089 [Exophiala spinifera]
MGLSIGQAKNGPNTKLDTSFFSISSDEDLRSPRTPTYVPEAASLEYIVPFHHIEMATDRVHKPGENKAIPKPPADEPMAWVWICHLCHSRYPLGVTRRCLVDGHYYCSGETDRPSLRRKKKNKSCSSEFDYVAWKAWATWRRKVFHIASNPARTLRGCENCEFPSQCRYPPSPSPLPPQTSTSKADGACASESKKKKKKKKAHEEEKEKEKHSSAHNATTSATTSDGSVDFDQILSNILVQEDCVQTRSVSSQASGTGTTSTTPSRKKESVKRKTSHVPSSLEEDTSREAARLREMVGVDLWGTLEDVDLEKAKVD